MANTFNDFSVLFSSYMNLDPGVIHLNNAGVAPMSNPAKKKAIEALTVMNERGFLGVGELIAAYQEARALLALLVGAEPQQVAFMQTTAAAISQVAFGIKLKPEDEVVILSQEYPSNFYPWKLACKESGASLKVVACEEDFSIPWEALVAAITPKTRVVAVSWVQFQTGSTIDLKSLAEVCHRQPNCWLVVDVIQGLGAIPFDMKTMGVDAICGGSHKWLCGPLGQGFLVLAKHRITELSPLLQGAFTYGTPEDPIQENPVPRLEAIRYEPGSPMILGAVGMGASIQMLLELGVENIYQHGQALRQYLSAGLQKQGHRVFNPHVASRATGCGDRPSAILTFVPKFSVEAVKLAFQKNNITFAARAGGIRLSPHGFNSIEELERLLVVLEELEGELSPAKVSESGVAGVLVEAVLEDQSFVENKESQKGS